MNLTIDENIFKQYTGLKVGVIIIRNVNNTRRISYIQSLLRGIWAQRQKEFEDKDIHDEPYIKAWDEAFGMFGVSPLKHQHIVAKLLSRAKDREEVAHKTALEDLCKYFNLKYLLPVRAKDIDWLCGDLNLVYTKGGEPFRPINSIEVYNASEGEVSYMDKGGIAQRYWNYRECERTKLTMRTVNSMFLVEDLSNMHLDKFGEILREMGMNIIKYIGGEIEEYILTPENPSVDLGVEGRRTADDSKIPLKEKAYFLKI